MWSRIIGGIAALWGAGVLVAAFLRGGAEGSGAYGAGQTAGLVFGGLLLLVALYYLFKPAK